MLRNIKTVFINKLSLKWFGDVSMLSYTHLFVYSKSGTFYKIDFIYILTRWSRVVTSLIHVDKWTYCLNVSISLCLYFCQLGKACWFCWVFFFLTSTAEVFPPMQESAVRHMKSLLGSFSCCDRSSTWADSYRCNISHRVCRTGLSLFVLLMHW